MSHTGTDPNYREDSIPHSVYFPMKLQCVCWLSGTYCFYCFFFKTTTSAPARVTITLNNNNENSMISYFAHPKNLNGFVRVLHILPNNCRVLDSTQHCPFIVQMEVVETEFDSDAYLYHNIIGFDSLNIHPTI